VVLVDVGVNKGAVLFEMVNAFRTAVSIRAADLSATNVALVRTLLSRGCFANSSASVGSVPVQVSPEFQYVGGLAAHCAHAERARALLAARGLQRAWRVEEVALAHAAGATTECPTRVGWEHGHLGGAARAYGSRQPNARAAGACRRVAVTTLDAWLDRERGRRFVVKIDAEGFDGPVLRGATRLLRERRVAAVVFECCHLWDRAVAAGAMPPNPFGAPDGPGASWTNRSASHLRSLSIAARPMGFMLFALNARPGQLWQEIAPPLQRTDEELATYTRGRWANFALVDTRLWL
jgi:FkbM family methyltransferase